MGIEAKQGVDPEELRMAMDRAKIGYCQEGKRVMEELGPSSPQFAKHVKSCPNCGPALRKEMSVSNAN